MIGISANDSGLYAGGAIANFQTELLHNLKQKMMIEQKLNSELSAGTTAEQRTNVEDMQVSPACIKPNVGGSCYRCSHCCKIVKRDSEKQWLKSWCEQSQKYVRLQKV